MNTDNNMNGKIFMMFVRKDGLYISTGHFKNPDFDEDKLCFTCFELKKL
jgi:hypothetical protein